MSSEGSWNTRPMRARTASGSRATSMPATDARPDVGLSSVQRTEMVVDLPAPLGPRKPKISPRRTARSLPLTASMFPYVLTRPCTAMTTSAPWSAWIGGRSRTAVAVMAIVCPFPADQALWRGFLGAEGLRQDRFREERLERRGLHRTAEVI